MIDVMYINGMTKNFNNLNEIFDDNQLNITKIDCYNNQLIEIPELEEFSLENKVFLPVEIGHLINLQEFYCSNNQLKEIPKIYLKILLKVRSKTNLK